MENKNNPTMNNSNTLGKEQTKPKTIMNCSDEEFRKLIEDKNVRDFAKNNFETGIKEMRYEIERLEKTFDNFQQQEVLRMTVAGLVSLFIFNATLSNESLKLFLIFVFPLLIISFFVNYFSSLRLNVHRTSFPIGESGSDSELIILRTNAIATRSMWQSIYDKYEKVLLWHRVHGLVLRVFVSNFIIFYYLYFFWKVPSYHFAILISLSIIIIHILLYSTQTRSQNKVFDTKLKS